MARALPKTPLSAHQHVAEMRSLNRAADEMRRAVSKHRFGGGGLQRFREMVTLAVIAPELLERVELLGGLYPLRHH